MSHMPMFHSSLTFSLARPIVEHHEETSTRLPKLVHASAAPHHPIHLSVTSQIERDITSTLKPYVRLKWRTIGVLSYSTARTILDPVCSNQGVMESYEVASRGPSSNCYQLYTYTYKITAEVQGWKLLTNFNRPIKTTSIWCKQGVLVCFEVDSRLCHTSCTLSGLRPTTTLSPWKASDTPKSENLMPLTWVTKLASTTPSNNAISLPSTRARRILETSSNASSRLALHAQLSLLQCSREFRNVITPRRKISNVITRQNGCHKLTFLQKDDQYFMTLNDRPWQ